MFSPALAQAQTDVTLGVGSIHVISGSSDHLIDVSLANPDHRVSAIETLLVDEGDNLTCTRCIPDPVRAPGFMCFAYEQGAGGCKVVMVDISTSKLIETGNGTVFTIDYMVSGCGPSDPCTSIVPMDSMITDDLENPLSVSEESGEICFIVCGDIFPREDLPDQPNCGDGVVNIFDVLEAIDMVLGIGVHSDCQMTRADLPNGIPPDCRAPDGVINIFDVLVIVDLALGKEDCCSYYYTQMVNCTTDEDCDDGIDCTIDSCVDGSCQNTPDDAFCSNNDVCDGIEICDPQLGCQDGTPLECDDSVGCTDDTCDPIDGCEHTPNDDNCDDGVFCNGAETCDPLEDCQPGTDPCPDQICNEDTDLCEPPCQLTINPPSAILIPGDSLQFTAIETGTCETPDYEWTDNLEHGDVDADGLFTAFEEGSVTETGEVCVTDQANGDILDCASVKIIADGPGSCNVVIYEGDVPGRRNIPLGCDETVQLNACTDCVNPPCFEWFIYPPSTIGSSITTNPDGTVLFTTGCGCDDLVEETIIVVDPCNEDISDSIIVSIGSVMLDVLDTATRREDTEVSIEVILANSNFKVKGIQVDLSDEGDYLTCMGCEADPDRALTFSCSAAEQTNGDCKVILLSMGDNLIAEGGGTIMTVTHDIKGDTPADACFAIYPQNAKVPDKFGDPLSVCTRSGDVCPFNCGDVYPRECLPEMSVCGDGTVDIFDALEVIDIVLRIAHPSDCQKAHADVPNGILPHCSDPDGKIDLFDILVIIDMILGKANCCDYYYFGQIY